jgi:hypothetical protein
MGQGVLRRRDRQDRHRAQRPAAAWCARAHAGPLRWCGSSRRVLRAGNVYASGGVETPADVVLADVRYFSRQPTNVSPNRRAMAGRLRLTDLPDSANGQDEITEAYMEKTFAKFSRK